MPDWTKPMSQTYEYYTVDPHTLADVKRLTNITNASFTYDSGADTLGSARIDGTETMNESYVRAYLKTIQNGITEKHAIGTMLVQAPSMAYNGMSKTITMDCYTPLIELKEKRPPLGYTVRQGTRIMDAAYDIVSRNTRVPVNKVEPIITKDANGDEIDQSPTLENNFVANVDETWLDFVIALIKNANYELNLTEKGHILFSPVQPIESLQPVWTYNDDDKSILYKDITMNYHIYDVPNVVEVMYSYGNDFKHAIVKNEDPNSPVSIVNRGREIPYRDTNASLVGYATREQIEDYAKRLLKSLSTIEYHISYTHAYCPVRVGDCVRINYTRAGIQNVKAKVISQTIDCEPGCPVSETAVFTSKLWG